MVAHSRAERMTTRQFSKHTPEQIILTLGKGGQSQAESMNKADSCRLLISSDETLWRWLNQIRNLLRASHARLTKRVSEALCMRFNPQSRRRVRNNDCCVPEEA